MHLDKWVLNLKILLWNLALSCMENTCSTNEDSTRFSCLDNTGHWMEIFFMFTPNNYYIILPIIAI